MALTEPLDLLTGFPGWSTDFYLQAVTRNTLSALNGVMPPNENYMGIVLIGTAADCYSRSFTGGGCVPVDVRWR